MAVNSIPDGLRVLVVEDEMAIAQMIEETLRELHINVVGPAARLDAALQLAADERIDVAVLDINIRGGNSYAIADSLAGRGIPFILCSGYGNWAMEERFRNRPQLTKPFSMNDMVEKIADVLSLQTD